MSNSAVWVSKQWSQSQNEPHVIDYSQIPPNDINIDLRYAGRRTIVVSKYAPEVLKQTLLHRSWVKEDFEAHAILSETQGTWVYSATNLITQTPVALKVYRKESLREITQRQLERELRIQTYIDHPHIIKLYGAFEDDLFIYLVQELAQKGDLWKSMKQASVNRNERVLIKNIIYPFLKALAFLHTRGIVHRDIKPENVFLDSNDTLKLGDFGLSINIVEESATSRVGTLEFMAPEVLDCPTKRFPREYKDNPKFMYSNKIDVWSFGVFVYEVLLGITPFDHQDKKQKQYQIKKGTYTLPQDNVLSEEAKDFLKQCINTDPNLRPKMEDLLKHPWFNMVTNKQVYDKDKFSPLKLNQSVNNGLNISVTNLAQFKKKSQTSDQDYYRQDKNQNYQVQDNQQQADQLAQNLQEKLSFDLQRDKNNDQDTQNEQQDKWTALGLFKNRYWSQDESAIMKKKNQKTYSDMAEYKPKNRYDQNSGRQKGRGNSGFSNILSQKDKKDGFKQVVQNAKGQNPDKSLPQNLPPQQQQQEAIQSKQQS